MVCPVVAISVKCVMDQSNSGSVSTWRKDTKLSDHCIDALELISVVLLIVHNPPQLGDHPGPETLLSSIPTHYHLAVFDAGGHGVQNL